MPESFDDDESGFMDSLKGIRKLKFDRVDLNQQKHKPEARLQPAHYSESLASITQHASEHVSLSSAEQWFQHGLQKKMRKKIRMGLFQIGATLDLHGYRQQQAFTELGLFFQQSMASGLRFVLIIHGKGSRSESHAKLRPLVQQWLREQSNVLAFCPAQPRDGGSGASYVYLKPG
jgi:DNA-nicking Smr family endonuclease